MDRKHSFTHVCWFYLFHFRAVDDPKNEMLYASGGCGMSVLLCYHLPVYHDLEQKESQSGK